MSVFNIPPNITVPDFFKDHVAVHFERKTINADATTMKGTEFTVQYNTGSFKYCLRITDGRNMEIIEGGIDAPVLCLSMGEADFRDNITGRIEGGLDRFIDPTQILDPRRYRRVSETLGTLNLRLKKKNRDIMPVDIVFNQKTQPSVMLSMKLGNWVDMQKGKKNPQVLFMTGRMKVKGDMRLLLRCQSLM